MGWYTLPTLSSEVRTFAQKRFAILTNDMFESEMNIAFEQSNNRLHTIERRGWTLF
jgi:ornithine carbamoyltransferase